MKIGVTMFVTGNMIHPVRLGKALEDAGLESFWAPDHGAMPSKSDANAPVGDGTIPAVFSELADPFVLLSTISAATTTLKLGTAICVIPERNPLILAKQVGTLDRFSGGRLLFGIGSGWMREEIELFGVDFDTRWKYTRESVEFMKALWRDGEASYNGELVQYPSVICGPQPAQRPHPPILIGGGASPVTFRRIARWADGWFVAGSRPADVSAARDALAIECEKIGRDPAEIEISASVWDVDAETRQAYAAAGADRLVCLLYNHPGERIGMDRWRDASTAALQSPPPAPEKTLRAIEHLGLQAQS